jgi:hypothetical protein
LIQGCKHGNIMIAVAWLRAAKWLTCWREDTGVAMMTHVVWDKHSSWKGWNTSNAV